MVRSDPLMKLVVMMTLLLSDADVFFTFATFQAYLQKGFFFAPAMVSAFVVVYLGGAYHGYEKSKKFCKVLREEVLAGNYIRKDGTVVPIEEVSGYTENEFRKYMIKEGLGQKFFSARAKFIRNIVKPKHSIPFWRLAKYGWVAEIPPGEFAGILNANALYSFSIGFVQLGCSIYFTLAYGEDNFFKSDAVVIASMAISVLSFILSLMNILVAFPKVLNDLEYHKNRKEQMNRDIESQIAKHLDGMKEERDAKLAEFKGKAAKTQEYIDCMTEYQRNEEQLRSKIAEVVKAEYANKDEGSDRV